MKILISVILSVLITLAIIFVFYYFVPISFLDFIGDLFSRDRQFGATITTILGSDTLSASRTVINNNFTALNNYKIENSTTTLPLLTTTATLSTVGTITSGTWTGSAIGVGYGGTGTTTPTLNLVILGNGSSGLKTVNGLGTSGQFLTSNGAASAPTWTSASVDTNINYTWAGEHIWNASSTFNNTVWFNSNLYLNRISYTFPSTQSASSTALTTDGSGNLSWNLPAPVYAAGSSTIAVANTAENSGASSYTLIKEISVYGYGTVRVRFDIAATANTAYGKIYKNGVAAGTERSTTETTYKQYLENISGVEPGDLIQIYAYNANGPTNDVQIQNFRVFTNDYYYPTVTDP